MSLFSTPDEIMQRIFEQVGNFFQMYPNYFVIGSGSKVYNLTKMHIIHVHALS